MGQRTGRVKFWNESKGWGYIIDDENGTIKTGTELKGDTTYGCVVGSSEDKARAKERYTYVKLLDPAHSRLFNGNRVEFDLKEKAGPRSDQTHAVNVKIIN